MSVNLRKIGAIAAVFATAAFIATGCGDDSDGNGNGGGDLADKQELIANMGEETEPGLFNPVGMSYLDSVNVKGYTQFAGLYRLVGQDNEVEPHLATGEPEISEDGLTYTVKMRDDAEWSDGQPIVAEDVVTAVRHALDPDTGTFFAGFLTPIVGGCESLAGDDRAALADCPEPRTSGAPEEIGITAVDDTTVEIKLTQQVPWFTQLLTIQTFYPLRADQLQKLGDKYGEDPSTIVSGPFKLTDYSPGSQIVYEKNDSYFNADDVTLEKLTFKMVAEPTTAAREFERGDLHVGIQNVMFDAA
ncbi:MAG: dppE, partial [Thermoleophilia bacterium]|nr:dppE [Thermoleophilia bacterium]